jgi:hypothetical protein
MSERKLSARLVPWKRTQVSSLSISISIRAAPANDSPHGQKHRKKNRIPQLVVHQFSQSLGPVDSEAGAVLIASVLSQRLEVVDQQVVLLLLVFKLGQVKKLLVELGRGACLELFSGRRAGHRQLFAGLP